MEVYLTNNKMENPKRCLDLVWVLLMISIMTPPQPFFYSQAEPFPKYTVHIVDIGLENLMVGCGWAYQWPFFKTINNGSEYLIEFNNDDVYTCAFNWKNKHTKFEVFNQTINKLCIGGVSKDCFWRATLTEFDFLEETWETMYTW